MQKPWQLNRYLRLAQTLLREQRLGPLGRDAEEKLSATGRVPGTLDRIRDDLSTLVQLVRAYASGAYRDVPRSSLLLIAAGVLYFVSPLDLIPDLLVGVGFLDDVTVLTYVIRVVRGEIDRFRRYAASQHVVPQGQNVAESVEGTRQGMLPGTVSGRADDRS